MDRDAGQEPVEMMKKKTLGADAAAADTARSAESDVTGKHVLGLWNVARDEDDPGATINIERDGVAFASVWNYEDFACVDDDDRERIIAESTAIAHLIAAAPTMYEALKSIVGCKAFTCDCGIPEEVFDSIEAAIAKAEGEVIGSGTVPDAEPADGTRRSEAQKETHNSDTHKNAGPQ